MFSFGVLNVFYYLCPQVLANRCNNACLGMIPWVQGAGMTFEGKT